MVQIIQAPQRKKSIGELLGAGLGQGIASGVDMATKLAINEKQSEKDFLRQLQLAQMKNQPKPLNELQLAQKNLAEAKKAALEEETSYFNQIMGLPSNEDKTSKLNLPGITNIDEIQESEEPSSFDISKIPEKKLRQLAAFKGQPGKKGVLGTMASSFLESKEKKEDKNLTTFQKDRDYHTKFSKPIIEAATDRLKTSDVNRGIRDQLKRDISSGETSGFFPYMVDRLGLESFRNPESARFSNEVKNIFVGSLNEIPGARPNQFLEKLLSTAQPQIGRSIEANLSVMDIADFVEDLRDEQAKKELEIAKEDRKEFGYVKEDVAERARERMGDYANRKQEQMALKIRERHEKELEDIDLINELLSGNIPEGTYITPRVMKILFLKNGKDKQKTLQEAQKLGLKFPEYLD